MSAFEEMRQSPRMRVLKDGKVVVTPPSGTIDVRIRDQSQTGARLELNAECALEPEFDIIFVSARTQVKVRLVWQRGRTAGVKFIGPHRQIMLRKI